MEEVAESANGAVVVEITVGSVYEEVEGVSQRKIQMLEERAIVAGKRVPTSPCCPLVQMRQAIVGNDVGDEICPLLLRLDVDTDHRLLRPECMRPG